jgi:hypothetical protein
MKKLLFLLVSISILSCSADDATVVEEEVTLFVDHYKTTSILNPTSLLIQEDVAIGTDDFEITPSIKEFTFIPGQTATLTARKITTKNAGTDATTVHYELISLQDQEQVAPGETFQVPLTKYINGIGYVSWVAGNSISGFSIASEIDIDCGFFCDELDSRLRIEDIITGTFIHGEDGSYILEGLN